MLQGFKAWLRGSVRGLSRFAGFFGLVIIVLHASHLALWIFWGNEMKSDPASRCDRNTIWYQGHYYSKICPTRFTCCIGSGWEAYFRGFVLALRVSMPEAIVTMLYHWYLDKCRPANTAQREAHLTTLLHLIPASAPYFMGATIWMYSRENDCPAIRGASI